MDLQDIEDQEQASFLKQGGYCGALMRSIDWEKNALGDPEHWPLLLKHLTGVMLSSTLPIMICWGSRYIQLYNDAFRPILGVSKHPAAMGGYSADTFAEIWPTIGPMFGQVMEGQTIGVSDFLVSLDRNGYPEDCYFDFSYIPVRDESGTIHGVMVICLETTDKVRAIQNLSVSRENLRNTIKQAPVGMCLVRGLPLLVEEVNDTFLDIIGKTGAPPAPAHSFTPAIEAITDYHRITGQVLASGETYHVREQEMTRRHDGAFGKAHIDFVYEPLRDGTGGIDGIMILAMDVTDKVIARKTVEEHMHQSQSLNNALAAANEELTATIEDLAAVNEELIATNEELLQTQHELESAHKELAESESILKLAIEFTSLGTWDYDMVADKLHLSVECRDIFGFPPDIPISFDALCSYAHPADDEYVRNALPPRTDTRSDGKFDITYRIRRYDNEETRWIRVRGTTYFNGSKQAIRSLATVMDISESKQAEEKSAKLAAIVESSDDAIVSKTLESVITSWNDAAQRIFGYSAEEMIGESIYKLIPADRHDEEPHILTRLKSGERVEHFETQRLTRDGQLIDVSLTISPIKNVQGQIIGLSKIARDITEKKRDEQRKSDFIGMASHELKTPLTSLKAILQVLEMKLAGSEDEFTSGAISKANVQVNRMINMINGFLNISRLESGKIAIEKQVFDLKELIDEVIRKCNLSRPAT